MESLVYKYDYKGPRHFDYSEGRYVCDVITIPLDRYIYFNVVRPFDSNRPFVYKRYLEEFAQKKNIPVAGTKEEIMKTLLENLTLEDKLDFCDKMKIGITRNHYSAFGVDYKEFEAMKRSLKVVGTISTYLDEEILLYSIREYLNFIEAHKHDTHYNYN